MGTFMAYSCNTALQKDCTVLLARKWCILATSAHVFFIFKSSFPGCYNLHFKLLMRKRIFPSVFSWYLLRTIIKCAEERKIPGLGEKKWRWLNDRRTEMLFMMCMFINVYIHVHMNVFIFLPDQVFTISPTSD